MIYRKDRKVLKRVDYGAAKNSLMGVLAALVVYALVTAWGGVYRAYELETLIAGGAVVLVTAYRLWLVARFDALYGAGPARWRRTSPRRARSRASSSSCPAPPRAAGPASPGASRASRGV